MDFRYEAIHILFRFRCIPTSYSIHYTITISSLVLGYWLPIDLMVEGIAGRRRGSGWEKGSKVLDDNKNYYKYKSWVSSISTTLVFLA